nr:thioredoxin family protein [Miltoncostaea marina]
MSVRYFDGCPNWRVAETRLREVLRELGSSAVEVELERVETSEQAEAVAFRGSPTVLVDGEDLFLDEAAPVGLMCRIYATPDGLQGAPSVEQLRQVLAR